MAFSPSSAEVIQLGKEEKCFAHPPPQGQSPCLGPALALPALLCVLALGSKLTLPTEAIPCSALGSVGPWL